MKPSWGGESRATGLTPKQPLGSVPVARERVTDVD